MPACHNLLVNRPRRRVSVLAHDAAAFACHASACQRIAQRGGDETLQMAAGALRAARARATALGEDAGDAGLPHQPSVMATAGAAAATPSLPLKDELKRRATERRFAALLNAALEPCRRRHGEHCQLQKIKRAATAALAGCGHGHSRGGYRVGAPDDPAARVSRCRRQRVDGRPSRSPQAACCKGRSSWSACCRRLCSGCRTRGAIGERDRLRRGKHARLRT